MGIPSVSILGQGYLVTVVELTCHFILFEYEVLRPVLFSFLTTFCPLTWILFMKNHCILSSVLLKVLMLE